MSQSLEDLIRDTLTDPRRRIEPPPGHHQVVGERIGWARRRRNLRCTGAAAAAVALLVAGGVAVARPRPVPPPRLAPVPVTTPSSRYGGWVRLAGIGPGEPVQVVTNGAYFYLLEENPGTLLTLDSVNLAPARSVAVPDRPRLLAVDQAGDRTWVLYTRPDGVTMARAYDEQFTPVRDVPIGDKQLLGAVAFDGQLWLAAGGGLYRIGPSDTAPRLVPGFSFVYALAFEPARHRLILTELRATEADPNAGVQVLAMDPATMAVTAGATLPLSKESIAVVANHVWVAGFNGTDQPHIYQLDPDNLTVIGTSEVNAQVGPGAFVSGGDDSLWVRDGNGDGVSCVNPGTGKILQQWLMGGGPVASTHGDGAPRPLALSVNQPNLVQLTVRGGCPG